MNFSNFKDWLFLEDARIPEEIYKNILDWIKQNALSKKLDVNKNFILNFEPYSNLKPLHNLKDKYTVNVLFDTNCDGGNAYMNNFKSVNNELGGKNYTAKICISRNDNLTVMKSLLDHELFHFIQQVLVDKNKIGGLVKKNYTNKKNVKDSLSGNMEQLEPPNEYEEEEEQKYRRDIRNYSKIIKNDFEQVPNLQTILHLFEFGFFSEEFKIFFAVNSFFGNYEKKQKDDNFNNFIKKVNDENTKMEFLKHFLDKNNMPSNNILKQVKIILEGARLIENKKIYKYFVEKISKSFLNKKIKTDYNDDLIFLNKMMEFKI